MTCTGHRISGKFKEYEIDAFFYIGGNDSMDTVDKLSQYAKTIGNNIKIIGIERIPAANVLGSP